MFKMEVDKEDVVVFLWSEFFEIRVKFDDSFYCFIGVCDSKR